jgi:adenine phosphoribosyltransferase
MSLEILKKSLKEAPIVKKGEYRYVVHPITDGVPEIKTSLLNEVVCEMQRRIEKCGSIDKVVTMEAMGIPLATALSLNMDVPFTIIRKREYGLPDEISVEQVTGYSKSKLYINGLKKGDKIVIVDDVLSTGGTLRAVLSTSSTMTILSPFFRPFM